MKLFVDAGFTFSVVPYELAERFGAHKTPGKEKVSLVDGSVKEVEVASIYLVRLNLNPFKSLLNNWVNTYFPKHDGCYISCYIRNLVGG